MQHEENGCEKVLRPIVETNKGSVGYTNIQEFIIRTRQVKIIAVNIFWEEKHEVGRSVYHLKGLHVPQFENHCFTKTQKQ